MVAVEERNWLASANSVKLSVSYVLRSPSLKKLAELVAAKRFVTGWTEWDGEWC
jgi:hypothetical protein